MSGERRLEEARRAGNLANALAAAQSLVSRYPGKTDYQHILTSLNRAADLLRECETESKRTFSSWKEVSEAKRLVEETRAALRVAKIDASAHLLHWEALLDEAADGLKGAEQVKRQMATAVPRAAAAAVWIAMVWALSHLTARYRIRGMTGADAYSDYLWTRTSLCIAGLVVILALVSRRSWGFPAWFTGIAAGFAMACFVVLSIAAESYWTGMVVTMFGIGAITWTCEAGISEGSLPHDPLRQTAKRLTSGAFQDLPPLASVSLVTGAFVLFFLAPCWHVPSTAGTISSSFFGFHTKTDDSSPQAPVVSQTNSAPKQSAETPSTGMNIGPPGRDQPQAVTTASSTSGQDSSPQDAPADPAPPDDASSPPSGATPWIRIVGVDPENPIEGDDVRVFLDAGSASGDAVQIEARLHDGESWRSVDGDRFTLSNIAAGTVRFSVRAVTASGEPSPPQFRILQVLERPLAPRIVSLVADPDPPTEGGHIRLVVGSDNPGIVSYQYRHSGNEQWEPVIADRIELEDLVPGPMVIELRALDKLQGVSSLIETVRIVVQELAGPLQLTLDRVVPSVPRIGSDVWVHVESSRSSPDLEYRFRTDAEERWQSRPRGRFMIENVQAGTLMLQYCVVDESENEHSPVYEQKWKVSDHRFEVRGLSLQQDEIAAEIYDHDTEETHVVSRRDHLGKFVVAYVNLSLGSRSVTVMSPLGERLRIAIPSELITEFTHRYKRIRTTPGGGVRDSSRAGARRK